MSFHKCTLADDRRLNLVIQCRDFDFTLVFEQLVLVVGVSLLFLLLGLLRVKKLLRHDAESLSNWLHKSKIVFALFDAALQIPALVLWVRHPFTKFSIAGASLSLVAALGLLTLSFVEHIKTVRPSTLTSLYLVTAILADGVQLRTLIIRSWASPIVLDIGRLLVASLVCKTILLVLESWPKQRILRLGPEYSPEEESGFFGRVIYWWLNPLFWRGYNGILAQGDLFPLDSRLNSQSLRHEMIDCWERNKSKKSYPLIRATGSMLFWPFIGTIFPRIGSLIFTYSITFVMGAAIRYLEKPANERDIHYVYGLIAVTLITYCGSSITNTIFNHRMNRIQTIFRGGMASLIYHHALSTEDTDNNLEAITLMSNDVDIIINSLEMVLELWAYLIEVVIGVWLLWHQLGWVALVPVSLVLACSHWQIAIGKAMSKRRAVWTAAIQKRVGLTSNLLRSMKSIKLSGVVDTAAKLVQGERLKELDLGKSFRWMIVWMNGLGGVPQIFTALLVFGAYAIEAKLLGKPPLSTVQAFTSLALITIFKGPATVLLIAMSRIPSNLGTVDRIEKFLKKNRFEDHRPLIVEPAASGDVAGGIELKEVDLGIRPEAKSRPISMSAAKGSVTMISGPVGCGKSTLLKMMLGETQPKSGKISVSTPYIGYCSQTPWLQNNTLRKNIIGPNKFDELWYDKVVHACNLDPDIAQMPDKDDTMLGSRGVSVSGGQKHRIALARALYSRCAILLLDDLFSSLDRKTQSTVARNLFSDDGHIKTYGLTVLFTTHSAALVNYSEYMLVLNPGGSLTFFGPTEDWSKEKSIHQDVDLPEEEPAAEEKLKVEPKKVALSEPEDENERIKRQVGDATLWLYYFKAVGFWNIVLLLLLTMITVVGWNFSQLWLKYSTGSYVPPIGVFIGVYTMVSILTWSTNISQIILLLLHIGPKTAASLHHVLVKTTFNAPMSFFESTDTSILMNRFSQDMSLVELPLPIAIWQLSMAVMICLMNLALLSVGSQYMALSIPVIVSILYWIQKFYLRTSRQIRFLDLEAKSPLYQHFTETLEGLATIRAFGWQDRFEEEAVHRLEESQKPFYLMFCIQMWLNIVLNLLGAILAVTLMVLVLCIPSSSDPGSLGVGLTTTLTFNGSLQSLILFWTQTETSLGSIARTKIYEESTPNENETEADDPEHQWPQGNLNFSEITVTYKNETSALKNVDIHIERGRKLGICGRTGSGKSTLVSVLLRLVDPTSGDLLIDGVDIRGVARNTVRDRLVCLPQDPLLLPGTFQFNLDPEGELFDIAKIEIVLKQVQMFDVVMSKGGLNAGLLLDSLSVGEQQLLALARAIIKKQLAGGRCILVLDEFTSNLDPGTEAIVLDVIRNEFKDNTVLAVAHRLDTLRDFDTVVVLDKGKVTKIGPAAEVIAELKGE